MVKEITLKIDDNKFERIVKLKENKSWEELLIDGRFELERIKKRLRENLDKLLEESEKNFKKLDENHARTTAKTESKD